MEEVSDKNKNTNTDKGLAPVETRELYDFLKWIIGSVVLVLITTIIDSGLKSRDIGVKESELYSKFMTDSIIFNQNIRRKYELARFFKSVSVSEEVRKGWIIYFEEIKAEYKVTKDSAQILQQQSEELNIKIAKNENDPSKNSIEELTKYIALKNREINLKRQLNPQSGKGESDISNNIPTIYIQITEEGLRTKMLQLQKILVDRNYFSPGIEYVKNTKLSKNQIRYFYTSDIPIVKQLEDQLIKFGITNIDSVPLPGYQGITKPGTIEIWISKTDK